MECKKLGKKITAAILATAIATTGINITNKFNTPLKTDIVNAASSSTETFKSKLVYTFDNLPMNRVIQNFYINKDKTAIYGTMIRPNSEKKEDTFLIKFEIKGSKAVAKSFLIIKNGGHGTSLSGYYDDNNKLKLYVGINSGKGVSLIDASVLDKTGKNNKNINYYDQEKGTWKNALGQIINPKKIDENNDANFYKYQTPKRVIGFDKLCTSSNKEIFDRAAFVRASDGIPYVYVRYTKKDVKYLKIIRLSSNLDKKVEQQEKKTDVTKYQVAQSYNAIMKSTIKVDGINNLWQSEDVYLSNDDNRFFYLSTNTEFGDKLVIRRIPVGNTTEKTYIINGVKNKSVKAEEIEGISRVGKRIYFNHKVEYNNGEKIQTIEYIDLDNNK